MYLTERLLHVIPYASKFLFDLRFITHSINLFSRYVYTIACYLSGVFMFAMIVGEHAKMNI